MDFLTTTEISEKWGISRRRVVALCDEGRIEGAIQKGSMWLISEGAQKPLDGRKKNNKKGEERK